MIELADVMNTAGAIPSAKFGSATDNFEIETDGSTMRNGSSTMWDDLTGSLIARRLESTTGKLQYDYAENCIEMESGGSIGTTADRLIFNFQKPHGAKTYSEFRLHIHWEQVSSNNIEFTLQYRIQNNGSAKTTAWTTVTVDNTNNKFPYTSGTINQITELVELDWSTSSLSATCQFRLARTDSTAGDINATFVDGHVERDNIGSRTEYVK